jgi:hypothetical protein
MGQQVHKGEAKGYDLEHACRLPKKSFSDIVASEDQMQDGTRSANPL